MAINKSNFAKFRGYFLTGLITLLPLWLTLFIITILFKWITGLTAPFLKTFFLVFGIHSGGLIVNAISFFLTIFVISAAGFFTTHIFGRRLLISIEVLVTKVPFLSEIYGSVKKFIQFFTQKRAFRKVVLVEFPNKGLYSVGFITIEAQGEIQQKTPGQNVLSVFVPTTPNVTTGFLIYVPEKDLIPLEMRVDEAIKLVISGGIMMPEQRSNK